MKSNLTAIVITKNSEELLASALESLSFCDKKIIVDGGSTDKTLEIAQKYGVEVIKGVENDFSKQRAIGLNHAKTEWVFYLDSDELVTKSLEQEIFHILHTGGLGVSAYTVKRKNFYLGDNLWPVEEKFPRLFKKEALKEWKGKLHETPVVEG